MSAQVFPDLEAMSRRQRARELDEALRVRAMDAGDFSAWLKHSPPTSSIGEQHLQRRQSILSIDGAMLQDPGKEASLRPATRTRSRGPAGVEAIRQ